MAVSTFVARDDVDPQVSGTIDGLAAGATVSVTCDLGPNWSQFREVMVWVRVDNGSMNYPTVWFQDSPSATKYRLGVEKSSGIGATCCIKTPGDQADPGENAQGLFNVGGLYVRCEVQNTGASSFGTDCMVTFAAYD